MAGERRRVSASGEPTSARTALSGEALVAAAAAVKVKRDGGGLRRFCSYADTGAERRLAAQRSACVSSANTFHA